MVARSQDRAPSRSTSRPARPGRLPGSLAAARRELEEPGTIDVAGRYQRPPFLPAWPDLVGTDRPQARVGATDAQRPRHAPSEMGTGRAARRGPRTDPAPGCLRLGRAAMRTPPVRHGAECTAVLAACAPNRTLESARRRPLLLAHPFQTRGPPRRGLGPTRRIVPAAWIEPARRADRSAGLMARKRRRRSAILASPCCPAPDPGCRQASSCRSLAGPRRSRA